MQDIREYILLTLEQQKQNTKRHLAISKSILKMGK